MTISCSLGPQLKEDALSIDIKLLLNTEILKRVRNMSTVFRYLAATYCKCNNNSVSPSINPKDSSSVIQFVTRGNVQVNDRAVEVQKGLPEDISVSSSRCIFFPHPPGFIRLMLIEKKQQNMT